MSVCLTLTVYDDRDEMTASPEEAFYQIKISDGKRCAYTTALTYTEMDSYLAVPKQAVSKLLANSGDLAFKSLLLKAISDGEIVIGDLHLDLKGVVGD